MTAQEAAAMLPSTRSTERAVAFATKQLPHPRLLEGHQACHGLALTGDTLGPASLPDTGCYGLRGRARLAPLSEGLLLSLGGLGLRTGRLTPGRWDRHPEPRR